MYSSQSNTEKDACVPSGPRLKRQLQYFVNNVLESCWMETQPNNQLCFIFFVNWAPLKCIGAPVSRCKAEKRSRWHMIDLEAFKRVFFALIIMLRERESPLSVASHRRRPWTYQGTKLSFPTPPTMRHHARPQISEVQLKLSSVSRCNYILVVVLVHASPCGYVDNLCRTCGGGHFNATARFYH